MASQHEIEAGITAASAAALSIPRNDLALIVPLILSAAEAVRKALQDKHIEQSSAAYRKHGMTDFGV